MGTQLVPDNLLIALHIFFFFHLEELCVKTEWGDEAT